MVKLNIYFQDLKEDTQGELWQAIQKELLSRSQIEYKQEDETEEEFKQRLEEETDYYINSHNFANEFYL